MILDTVKRFLFKNNKKKDETVEYNLSVEPDAPIGFGCKISWLAIRAKPEAFLDLLGCVEMRPANWRTSFDFMRDKYWYWTRKDHIFVSPEINGWTFVIDGDCKLFNRLAMPAEEDREPALSFFNKLGERVGEFCYFHSYRVSDDYAWVRFKDKALQRVFYASEDPVPFELGEMTDEEKSLDKHLGFYDKDPSDGTDYLAVGEDHVLTLASQWSLDPCFEEMDLPPSVGWICKTE